VVAKYSIERSRGLWVRIGLIPFVLVAFVVAMAPPAHAQSDDAKKQAQALQVEGVRLLQKGDNRGALAKFNEAFALVQSPKIMFNMGKAYRALGDDVEALRAYDTFLDEAPYAPKASRAEAEREVQTLRPKLAYIEVEAEDSGSTVRIDGRDMGKTPLVRAVVVAPGAHEVKVEKTGMVTEKRSVAPIAGQKVRVVVKLSAVPAPEPAKPPVVAAQPPSDTPPARRLANNDTDSTQIDRHPPGIENPPPADVSPSGRRWQHTAAWVSIGLGAVALGGGITAQVLWSQKNNEFNAVQKPTGGPQCTTSMPPDFGGGNCLSLHQAADLRLKLAIAGYATAGAAAIAAVVFFLTAPGEGHAAAGNSVALGCLPTALSSGTSGVSCALTTRF
jgi:PEGA domain-containing protein